jgi:predicted RND superfamily exporter protein
LAEDFGIVLYEEWRTHPKFTPREVRKIAAPGIFWSAVTTCGAFLLLNLSGLPGLGQLGTLVAIGIAVAAIVMSYAYLPPLMPKTPEADAPGSAGVLAGSAPLPQFSGEDTGAPRKSFPFAWLFTALLLLLAAPILWLRPVPFDKSPDSLKPKDSEAYAALDEVKIQMNRAQEPLWVVVEGRTEQEVEARLKSVEPILARAVSNQLIGSYTLPGMLWPNAEHQQQNREATKALVDSRELIHHAAASEGFAPNSLALADGILNTWQRAIGQQGIFWPTNDNSQWILEKLTARAPNKLLAVGLIHRTTNAPSPSPPSGERAGVRGQNLPTTDNFSTLAQQLRAEGIWLSGWDLLGPTVSRLVIHDMPRVVIPILLLIVISLWLAFRNWREVLLSLATVAMAGVSLELIMALFGWSWNMMNIMAVPLLLGMGVDFGIHMQLALRRHSGDVPFVRRSIGRALLLAGSTTVAGFGSLSFASNAGMASLGKVCGTGIACAMLVAVYLLPAWWARFRK